MLRCKSWLLIYFTLHNLIAHFDKSSRCISSGEVNQFQTDSKSARFEINLFRISVSLFEKFWFFSLINPICSKLLNDKVLLFSLESSCTTKNLVYIIIEKGFWQLGLNLSFLDKSQLYFLLRHSKIYKKLLLYLTFFIINFFYNI